MKNSSPILLTFVSVDDGSTGFAVFGCQASVDYFLASIAEFFALYPDEATKREYLKQFTSKEITEQEAQVLSNLFPETDYSHLGSIANFALTDTFGANSSVFN
jgi:hypothetical protein